MSEQEDMIAALRDRLAEVEKERDTFERVADWNLGVVAERDARIAEVEKERDIWQEHHHCAVRERDEARACHDALPCDRLTRMAASHSQAVRERDEARARIEQVEGWVTYWLSKCQATRTLELEVRARLAEVEKERDEARAALEFYADGFSYWSGGGKGVPPVLKDHGARARAVLSAPQTPEDP